MRRFTMLTLVACVSLGFAATAEADNGKNRGFAFEQFLGSNNLGGMISQFKNKKKKDKNEEQSPTLPPIDPGKGDGKPSDPIPTKPGYVWVGDHWERVRANSSQPTIITDPVPGTVVVRDHRTGSQGSGGVTVTDTVIVRDHRTLNGASSIYEGAVIRDHRGGQAGGSNPLSGAASQLIKGANGVTNTVGNAAGTLGRTVTSGAKGIGRTVGSAAGAAGSAVGSAAKGIGRGVSSAAGAVGDAIGKVLPF